MRFSRLVSMCVSLWAGALVLLVCIACVLQNPARSFSGFSSLATPTLEPLVNPSAENGSDDSFCPILQSPQVMNLDVYALPQMSEPLPRVSFHDPVFGSCIARISDHEQDLVPEDLSPGLRPDGAGVQAFNADDTLILARSNSWFWYVYSAETLQMVMTLPFSGNQEVRWDPVSPARLYVLQGARLYHYFLRTGECVLVHDFAIDLSQRSSERIEVGRMGNPSSDGRFLPLVLEGASHRSVFLLIYDLAEDHIQSQRLLPAGSRVEEVALSSLGIYVLAWFEPTCPSGSYPEQEPTCGLVAYDQRLENDRVLLPSARGADVALDSEDREVLVYHDPKMNSISMLNLRTGQEMALWLVDPRRSALGMSISGRAGHVPGWALISTYGGSVPADRSQASTWMDNAIFAIELKAEGRVVRLANTFSQDLRESHNEYWAGPQATVNLNFTRILFTSNWGWSDEGHTELYLIGLPPGWTQMLP